jgi:hypothetical protein
MNSWTSPIRPLKRLASLPRAGHRRGRRPDGDACRWERRRAIYCWSLSRFVGLQSPWEDPEEIPELGPGQQQASQPQPEEQLEITAPATEEED